MVLRTPEVVQDPIDVGYGCIGRQQISSPLFAERLRRDDVGTHAQSPPRQCGRYGTDIGVTAQHEMSAAYRALRGLYANLRTVLVAQYLGIFIDHGTGRFCGAGQALSVLEGVQVPAA